MVKENFSLVYSFNCEILARQQSCLEEIDFDYTSLLNNAVNDH